MYSRINTNTNTNTKIAWLLSDDRSLLMLFRQFMSSSSRWLWFCCYNQSSIVLVVTAIPQGGRGGSREGRATGGRPRSPPPSPWGRGRSSLHLEGVPIPMGLQIWESQKRSPVLTPFTKHRKRVSIPSEVPEMGARIEGFGVP